MDLDKVAAFISKVGVVPTLLGWLAWELHSFIREVASSQTQMVDLLRQLIDLHK